MFAETIEVYWKAEQECQSQSLKVILMICADRKNEEV